MSQQKIQEQVAGGSRSSIIRPMQFGNVPDVNARYWTLMTLASIFGCNTGDDCSYYAGWNHWIGLGPLALIFAALLFGERHSTRRTQAWYWASVVVLRTAATNLADLATHTFGLPYLNVILVLTVLQALVVWRVAPRLLAVEADWPGRPSTNGWYWLALITAGTLGTVMGDWVAEELHLSTGYGTLLLGVAYLLILAGGRRVHWTTKVTYWPTVVAVRAAGTTAGDWLAFQDTPGLHNGLHLGLPISSAISGTLLLGCLFAWKTGSVVAASEVTSTAP